MPFINAWNALQTQLPPGTSIPNWTVSKGLLGDSFVVSAVGPNHIEVDTSGARNRQRVPLSDFQTVYEMWDTYCRGQTP